MRDPLDRFLEELRRTAKMPAQGLLYYLSNLEPEQTARVRDAWPHLPVVLRRRLVTRLVDLAEADFTLNFGAVFRLALEDEDADVRTAAIGGLWEDRDPRLVPRLVECLQEDDAISVRSAAATSLGRFMLLGELEKIRAKPRAAAYEALLGACRAPDEHLEVRRRALESLAYVGNETVVESIREAYAGPQEKLRISAVFAMGRSADPRWSRRVWHELFSTNPEMRYEAARACGELQLSEAVPGLTDLADDVDSEVQEAALWALGQIGGDRAREVLELHCHSENEAMQAAARAAMDELHFLHGHLSDLFTRLVREPSW